ncbi:DUF1735 domain-containing protein [Chitinophaga sp.]|uniref:BT_3987 domain-containing protein n=1 Tax=Chitinophaga sp. TaxID=1869181 RepID=UPI00261DC6E5|nr:DUF1735 domain-containing protein [uncultured Chitinophaga sp.]
MQKLSSSIYILTFALTALGLFSGCGKDEQPAGVAGIYIVPASQAVSEEFKVSASTPVIRFAAAMQNPASGNVSAQLAIDNSLIAAFNTNYKTNHLPLPDGSVTLKGESVTIPQGHKTSAKDSLVFNSLLLDPGASYLLPLKIVQASGGGVSVVPAMAVKYYIIKVKPPFEGRYASSGTRFNFNTAADAPGNPVNTSPWSFDTDVKWASGSTYKVHAANANGDFGTISLTVNADNTVQIQPNAETTLTRLVPTPGKTSAYDPETKSFQLYYEYTNDNGTFRTVDHRLVLK